VKQLTAQFVLKTAGQEPMPIWTKSGTFNCWTWIHHSTVQVQYFDTLCI